MSGLDTIPTIGEQVDALEMAIKALEQKPCDDCVSKQAVINAFYIQSDNEGWWTGTAQDVEELLNSLQSTQLKPKTGKWILDADREHGRCSECGCKEDLVDGHSSYKWCSNCGIKMEVSE